MVPILKHSDYLIATVQAALSDLDILDLRDELVTQVGRYRAQGVILDVTALDVMDSFAVRMLRTIAQMTRLRGAQTVIVGIAPQVAMSMVDLGMSLEGVTTALDLEEGLAVLDHTKAARGHNRAP